MEKKQKIKREKSTEGKPWICLVKGIAIAFAITCVVFIGCGILLTYLTMSEKSIPVIALGCTALSSAAAGYDWAVCMKHRGIFWGMAAGLVYSVLLYFVTSLAANDFSIHMSFWMTLIVALAGGAVGGIMGINRKK